MKITGDQLLFLIQVLKDSVNIKMGYDWNFKYTKESRAEFYEKFINSMIKKETLKIDNVDYSKFKEME